MDYDQALSGLLTDINRVNSGGHDDGPATEENVARALLRIYAILCAMTRQP